MQVEAAQGRLRCLAALAEWDRLSLLARQEWHRVDPQVHALAEAGLGISKECPSYEPRDVLLSLNSEQKPHELLACRSTVQMLMQAPEDQASQHKLHCRNAGFLHHTGGEAQWTSRPLNVYVHSTVLHL